MSERAIEEALTKVDENEALLLLIQAQWNRVRVFLETCPKQEPEDINKEQEKIIHNLKKELKQEQERNNNLVLERDGMKERNNRLLLEHDGLIKKHQHAWIC